MRSFTNKHNTVPAAQAALNAHDATVRLIEVANKAVLEAVAAVMAFDDPLATNLFNADVDTLMQIAQMPSSRKLALAQTGIPLFALRTVTPEFKRQLDGAEGDDAALQALLSTFLTPPPVKSLG